jgi:hypothetical protein
MLKSYSGYMVHFTCLHLVVFTWFLCHDVLYCFPLVCNFPANYTFCIVLSMLISVCWWAGRFLGELTKQVFSDLVASKYQVLLFPICRWFLYIDVDSGFLILLCIFQWYLNLWYCIFFVKCLKAVVHSRSLGKNLLPTVIKKCQWHQIHDLRPCFFVVFLFLFILFSFSRIDLIRKICLEGIF